MTKSILKHKIQTLTGRSIKKLEEEMGYQAKDPNEPSMDIETMRSLASSLVLLARWGIRSIIIVYLHYNYNISPAVSCLSTLPRPPPRPPVRWRAAREPRPACRRTAAAPGSRPGGEWRTRR